MQKATSQEPMSLSTLKSVIEKARRKLVPDRRTLFFDVRAEKSRGKFFLCGEVHNDILKKDLFAFISENTGQLPVDNVTVLPETSLSKASTGVITLSTANVHGSPDHSSTILTQALLGTPVRILKRKGDWYLVQLPDRYIGWTDGTLRQMTDEEFGGWAFAGKIIITEPHLFLHEGTSPDSDIVSDVVAGNILAVINETRSCYRVSFPDGRKACVPKSAARKLDEWTKVTILSEQGVTATAKLFIGVPYLWGGTSYKALDCSGFVKTVYFLNGVILPRDADQQSETGTEVDPGGNFSTIRPGDLLFFSSGTNGDGTGPISHVGISLGGTDFLEESCRVRISSLDPDNVNYAPRRAANLRIIKRIIGCPDTVGVVQMSSLSYYSGTGREFMAR